MTVLEGEEMNATAINSYGADPPKTVLVVEDEFLIRSMIIDYLTECGYHVIEAGTGDEAVEVLLRTVLTVNVVVSDVMMPGTTDGFALARWVGKWRPDIKVVLTSGLARTADAGDTSCFDAPVLRKPYDLAKLERRIKGLLAQ